MTTICDECGKELNGLSFDYGERWLCSNCTEDKKSVLNCETGCKVVVKTLDAGWDCEKEEAEKIFNVGEVYIVDTVNVGSWTSTIMLKEVPDKYFNTVFFERVN